GVGGHPGGWGEPRGGRLGALPGGREPGPVGRPRPARRGPRPDMPDRHQLRKRERADRIAPRRFARGAQARPSGDGAVILYGWHTVKAALENPARRIRHLYATGNAARRLAADGVALG